MRCLVPFLIIASFSAVLPALCAPTAAKPAKAPLPKAQAQKPIIKPGEVSIKQFGARGDGKTDDTAAFQAALNSLGDPGGTVSVPVGNYLIKTHLNVPDNVTLEGVFRIPTARSQMHGSTLLAVEGAGSESGPPFLTLNANSTLKGITIFYPNQRTDTVVPYPWCVASSGGDNPSIVDCLIVNPYQCVDFATHNPGRHYIRGLYGQPLRRGIFIDKCFDVGRIENVHFWPFWADTPALHIFVSENGEAFIFGRTDWEAVTNTFCLGYHVGYHFIHTPDGETNGSFLGIGCDASGTAVLVEATQTPGLLITNGEFVSLYGEHPTEVVVTKSHTGVVQFQNCAFWGPADQIATVAGTGYVSFNNCNFRDWDRANKGLAALTLSGGDVTVNGCNFSKPAPQVVLDGDIKSVVFVGNHTAGPLSVQNTTKADLQIGMNTVKH